MNPFALFKAYSPQRQILVTAGLALVIALALSAAYFTWLRQPYDRVFTGLRPGDAAAITAALDKEKIPYRLKDGGATILAPRDQADRVRLDIASQDLPIKGMVGFELFNKADIGLTEFAQKINYQRALQGELARTIMTLDTVDAARVHLSMSEPTVFRDDRRPPKASVTLLPRPGRTIAPETVTGVQRLVAAAVPDLNIADVVVLDEHGQVISGEPRLGAPVSPEGQERQAIEQYYVSRIRQALAAFPANAVADVAVSANIEAVATPADDTGAILHSWSPDRRGFPLGVTLAFDAPPTTDVETRVKAITAQAIGLNPNLNDTLTVSVVGHALTTGGAPGLQAATPSGASAASPRALAKPPLSPTLLWAAFVIPLSILLFVGAFVLRPRGRMRRGLTPQERQAYARRLTALIEDGEAHASPSV
ncbi:MAG: flagellar basal-body MS-ring/collar protein FliF [Caulobacteraceae bacterium]|nr:flagellar basal-body MS-ring/collar protein FliF [Caulobacteraceae bacterium]